LIDIALTNINFEKREKIKNELVDKEKFSIFQKACGYRTNLEFVKYKYRICELAE